ncbi:MAG: class D sortase [Acidobacteria bacterium]|nr:class D sortase [Acidobacteriota bacterium]
MRTRILKPLSWLLIIAGVYFLFAGAREIFDSYWGQHEAAAEWSGGNPASEQQAVPDQAVPDLGPAFARLSIPRLSASWFVFQGTNTKELRLGPGHMEGTALPGAPGNCVIAGHRDTHFRVLKDVRKGDEIVVTNHSGKKFIYRVTRIRVVSEKNTDSLKPTKDAVMNLITCYPFYYVGPAPKRYVVEAELEQPS